MHCAQYAIRAYAALLLVFPAHATLYLQCDANADCYTKCCGTSYSPSICIGMDAVSPLMPCWTEDGCDCFERTCENGHCAGCTQDQHCPSDGVCCPNGACVDDLMLCDCPTDCYKGCADPMVFCPDGTCADKLSDCVCQSNDHCFDDQKCCLNGSCVPALELCDCSTDNDCPSPSVCCLDGTCAKTADLCGCHNGGTCFGGSFCCSDGTCVGTLASCDCGTDNDCPLTSVCCLDGTCANTTNDCGCHNGGTCPGGTFCCSDGTCADNVALCDCGTDNDCPSTSVCCLDGTCAKTTNYCGCDNGGTCPGGTFCCSDRMCADALDSCDCGTDTDCPSTSVCCSNGTCAETKETCGLCKTGLPGVKRGSICCDVDCGTCGGTGCSSRPGGPDNCCHQQIGNGGVMCSDTQGAPCIIQNMCDNGLPGVQHYDVCCHADCGTCRGSGCEALPGGPDNCCHHRIKDSGVICSDTQGAPCIAQPLCSNGLPGKQNIDICCHPDCGPCGGDNCGKQPDGLDNCCAEQIRNGGVICSNTQGAPCIIKPMCDNGLPGLKSGDICCDTDCLACGGGGCDARPGGPDNCCSHRIRNRGVFCRDTQGAPCIVQRSA